MSKQRLSKLRAGLAEHADRYDGIFITKPENRSYLSGFSGSFGYLLVTPDQQILFTDGRYLQQAAAQSPDWRLAQLKRPFEESVIAELDKLPIARLAFEADHLSYADYTHWRDKLPKIEWIPTTGVVAKLRRIKDSEEVAAIRRAVEIAEQGLEQTLTLVRPGMTERQVAAQLEFAMRSFGADAIAFDTIVASGPRGSLPHGKASDRVINSGDMVTVDFGAHYQGYNSDITRSFVLGTPDSRQREIYNLVLQAQLAGVAAVRPGVRCCDVDAAARQVLIDAGLGEEFVHGLGHNLGREVHESPFLTKTDETVLEAGMVLTIEPGLYINDWGGVRIEDDLLVTTDGAQVLPRFTKELIQV